MSTTPIRITGKLYDVSVSPPKPIPGKTIHVRTNLNGEDIGFGITQKDGSFSIEMDMPQNASLLYLVFEEDETYSGSYTVIP